METRRLGTLRVVAIDAPPAPASVAPYVLTVPEPTLERIERRERSGRPEPDPRRRNRRTRRTTTAPWVAAVAAPVLLGAATLVLRLLTAAQGPTDWDSAQYVAGVTQFDVTHGRPHPPGYWLYVESGRLVHQLTGLGAVRSLVIVSALASAGVTAVTALAGRDLGGAWVGVAAGCVMAT
ncbi:MAG TPA: hypothetical protein VEJ44_03560, partial [Acidimicrobiales bacterium]|nr:hypothetical protein [Acidimicrobiales bacterium]